MKKLLVGILTAACAASAVLGLSACGGGKTDKTETGWGKEYTFATAYAKAVELGYDKTLDDFIAAISGKDGDDGKDGVGIKNAEINNDGELVITLSDDIVKNLGKVVGSDGKDGDDGLGIKEIKFDNDGNLIVIFNDDTKSNLGKVPYCKHNFPSEWETVLEATCLSIGYCTRECDICGYVEYKFTEAKGHTWDDGVDFGGKILKTCTVCHATQIEDKPTVEEPPVVEDVKFILPVENAEVSTKYEFAYDSTLDRYTVHQGIDYKSSAGTNVKAVLDGTVTEIVTNHTLGENYVTITHSDGLTTTYKYIVAAADLKEGDAVKQGDVIGVIAAAGGMEMNKGEHLHFVVTVKGKIVDPEPYFKNEE